MGSRRLVNALKTVPSPMTTNVIVEDALALSTLQLVRAGDQRNQGSEEQDGAVEDPHQDRCAIGDQDVRVPGGRLITSGSPGSTVMMTTPGTVAKKSRYSTIVGVSATPWLMLNTLAATNSITKASS